MEEGIPNLLDMRIAVVTGGNKGIGLEICKQLATEGIMVILTARDEKKGMEALEKIKNCGLSNSTFHQLDVTNSSSIARLADFVKTKFGKLDILVNNAGSGGVVKEVDFSTPIEKQLEGKDASGMVKWMANNSIETYETAEECLRTNYYGTKNVTEAFIPLLQSSTSGRIVNLSSVFGLLRRFSSQELKQELDDIDNLTEKRLDELLYLFLKNFKDGKLEAHGWPTGFSAYKVSKSFLNAYSRILAKRYPEFRINCIHPGYVKTDITMQSGFLTAEEGANGPVMLALLPDDGPTGAYFDRTQQASFL